MSRSEPPPLMRCRSSPCTRSKTRSLIELCHVTRYHFENREYTWTVSYARGIFRFFFTVLFFLFLFFLIHVFFAKSEGPRVSYTYSGVTPLVITRAQPSAEPREGDNQGRIVECDFKAVCIYKVYGLTFCCL